MAKDSYEISLWNDIFVAQNGNIPGHYEEEKIAIIGSDTMTADCRAIEPKLVCNINGKVTFTFKMYLSYKDELTGNINENPFLKLLVNERKVKVKWLNKWYDLVIKNIQESSNGKTVIYSCEDANIQDLAKSGFDLIFDDDLSVNNIEGGNQGTAQELVSRTINGTDWIIGDNDIIQQFTEEAVFELDLTHSVNVINMATSTSITIPAQTDSKPTKVLVFYPQLADFINKGSDSTETFSPLYLAYDSSQEYNRLAKTEMLVQADCCSINSCICTISNENLAFRVDGANIGNININNVSDNYRANRLVSQPVSRIEPISGNSCYIYTALADGTGAYAGKVNAGDVIYEHIGTEFNDALYATNLIANGMQFLSTDGWESPTTAPLSLTVYPSTAASAGNRQVYLCLPATTSERSYYNDAIRANSQYFKDGCKQGEIYRVRLRVRRKDGSSYTRCTSSNLNIYPEVTQWANNINLGCKVPTGQTYFSRGSLVNESDGWLHFDLICTQTFSGSDIYKDNIGLFIKHPANTEAKYIEEIQFFKVIYDVNNTIILPDELNKTGIARTTYTYYRVKNQQIEYLYKGVEDWDKTGVNLEQKFNDGYSKIRAINIKQSNRFNILQTIAETFECWIRFQVPHDPETGKLIYVNGIPKKEITIKREMGDERGIGFVYGIDLQSIQRTIESNQIVTKTIVLENNNQFGKNGTCRISRSNFNYPQLDYIFNFDYYINHELIDKKELTKDLYNRTISATSTEGYYASMHKWNTEYIKCSEENANYQTAVTKDEGLKEVYEIGIDAAKTEIKTHQAAVTNLAGTTNYNNSQTQNFIAQYIDDPRNGDLKAHVATIEAQLQLQRYYENQVAALNTAIEEYNTKIAANETKINTLIDNIRNKTLLFHRKYARFISEGSWIDQKYYDDNLYYVDANSVAYTSSRPKVSYNIQVMRVTSIEGFELKDFQLGDISYIEDKDFFGYITVVEGDHEVRTPYREKVVITEVTYNFDEPQKDSFQVQNYRTQFEDLFQRIAAQTQSLQYSVGAYKKVSDIINSDGSIKGEILQSSVNVNNEWLNRTTFNNLVVTDESGITVSNTLNPATMVKITYGGVFITTNGGDSWNNAIRGDGIGTEFLSSGAINTRKIQIINGGDENDAAAVAFKWDVDGITAYDSFSTLGEGMAYDKDRYVRFNNQGIQIQTKDNDENPYTKLKLGRLNAANKYGLEIYDPNGNPVFSADDNGNLSVVGNITATSLTLGETVSINGDKVVLSNGQTVNVAVNGLTVTTENLTSQYTTLRDDLSTAKTSIQQNANAITATATAINTRIDKVTNGYTIVWDSNQGASYAGGEAKICKYDHETGQYTINSAGWVMWYGTKRTVPCVEFNPNAMVPYNIPIYLVLRLSSASATTGTCYPVWYNSGWKYLTKGVDASASGQAVGNWSWVENTDIVLGKCVEPASEAVFTDTEVFDPPRTSKSLNSSTLTKESLSASITVNANAITSKVSKTDYTGATIASLINQSATSVVIQASHISLAGKTIDLTSDNIAISSTNFSVTKAGAITAKSGTIANWSISGNWIEKYTTYSGYQYHTYMFSDPGSAMGNGAFGVRRRTQSGSTYGSWEPLFHVTHNGALYASNADIKGTIKATDGTIGRYKITSTYLQTGSGSNAAGMGGDQAFYAGSTTSNSAPFRVSYGGALVATNATITGTITSSNAKITNGTIDITTDATTNDKIKLSYSDWTTAMLPIQLAAFNSSTKDRIIIQAGAIYGQRGATNVTGTVSSNYFILGHTSGGGGQLSIYDTNNKRRAAFNDGGLYMYGTSGETLNIYGQQYIELWPFANSGHGGYIDFHYNRSTADYTSRLIGSSNTTTAMPSITNGSDRRIKEDVEYWRDNEAAVNRYCEFIDTLSPVKFKYKNFDGTHYGFIAQDIIAECSRLGLDSSGLIRESAVFAPEDDTKYYTLNYIDLIALLVNYVQRLKSRVESLEDK